MTNILDDQAKEDLFDLYESELCSDPSKRIFFWTVLECAGCEEEFREYLEERENKG